MLITKQMNFLTTLAPFPVIVTIPRPYFISKKALVSIYKDNIYKLINTYNSDSILVDVSTITRIIVYDNHVVIELSFGVSDESYSVLSKPESRRSPVDALAG